MTSDMRLALRQRIDEAVRAKHGLAEGVWCKVCGETKPHTEFYRKKGRPQSECKRCSNKRRRVNYWKNAERERQYQRFWRMMNSEKVAERNRKQREYKREWQQRQRAAA